MRRFLGLTIVWAALAGLVLQSAEAAAQTPSSITTRTFAVLVGWENADEGIGINAYFPQTVTIHAGDTVHWVQNTNEIHTVTFLDGLPMPELLVPSADVPGADPTVSPLMFNPAATNPVIPPGGEYAGGIGAHANSGIMGRESGQVEEFNLTFTAPGTYDYVCLVHGSMMSGQVTVVPAHVHIRSPGQVMTQAQLQIAEKYARVPSVLGAARRQIKPAVKNADGTMTYTVMIGYNDGQIDLMKFFPDTLRVGIGDTVIWEMSPGNVAPHTVTFLNGQAEPELTIPVSQSSGPPLLYANPAAFFPSQPGPSLTRAGIYNSGVLQPVPGTTYSLVMGEMAPGPQPYLCLLHDTSGMRGSLYIAPQLSVEPHHPFGPWPWGKGSSH
jgi:plastocyanin